MSIWGNTVGTTTPRSDWNQTDPKKADFIFNKPSIPATADDVGARPNTWLPTIAEIGAAPAGYGLGVSDAPFHLTADSTAFDNFLNIGWYAIQTTFKISDKTFYFVMLRVTSYSYGSGCLMQEVIPVDTDYILRRYCLHGLWTEWDWDCPPMTVGAEYRTTERYNGKPVYTKLIDCGASVNEKVITFTDESGNPTFYNVIRHAGRVGSMSLPAIWGDTKITTAYCHMYCDGWRIRIFCTEQAEFTGQQSYCQIWYTKD